ncbi:MAG: hypothetical protein IT289_09325 [Oligoflexia bacterium]|nr:hypothetical protein [Oligoflexia bacterium]
MKEITLALTVILAGSTGLCSDWISYDLSGGSIGQTTDSRTSYSDSSLTGNGSSSVSDSSGTGSSSTSYYKKEVYRAASSDAALYLGGMEPTFLLVRAMELLKKDLQAAGHREILSEQDLAVLLIQISR